MANTPRAIIIGRPVRHARSPLIHEFWLHEAGLDGTYERAEVMPGAVAAFLRELPKRGYVGGNVTVPHKEEAFDACDRVSDAARAARAVNTFWFENGALMGDNTDGSGFIAHLDQTYRGWDVKTSGRTTPHILILGAGGAARGLILPLLDRKPAALMLANRSQARADSLIGDALKARPGAPITSTPWDRKAPAVLPFDLVINTTSLGMAGQPPLDIDLSTLPPHAIVADIVYVPLETPLLAAAAARGLRTLDGLGMLLHQAVPGFTRWFGVRPSVTPQLRAHVVADLKPKAG